MSLLSKETRIKYFKDLGLGEYTPENILKFQQKAFTDPKEHDKKYGKRTDAALKHWHNVWKYCENFKPEEFKCRCGRCSGYPTWMKANELKHIQTIRTHYGKPMNITSGLRCESFNRKVGGVSNSRHLEGRAVDFYMPGVTDTLEHRRSAVRYIKGLPNHHYTYGNGIDSAGRRRSAPGMGNAVHTDTNG